MLKEKFTELITNYTGNQYAINDLWEGYNYIPTFNKKWIVF